MAKKPSNTASKKGASTGASSAKGKGSAKAIVGLAAELGVKLTPAGATWPYGRDPEDTNIRIAPTYPSLEDLGSALDVFVVAVKLVSARLAKAARDGQQG